MKYLFFTISAFFILSNITSAQTAGNGDNSTGTPGVNNGKLTENIIINNWSDAKTKYRWDWLETPKDDVNVYRYFSKESLMVVCKAPELIWAQADLPYNPLPAFWYYEASFNNVKGKSKNVETGLLLKATSYGEEVKVFFVVNHFDQKYAFIQYNMVQHRWLHLNRLVGNTNNFSAAINKYDTKKDLASNKIKLQREGNIFLLYINDKLVETVVLNDPASSLNKLQGIGITGKGHQAYYVDKIKFVVHEEIAKKQEMVKTEVTSPEKNTNEEKEKPVLINENKPVPYIPYEKYSADELNKAEEKLINYLKQTDREFNPLAEKILKSGEDKWILYKTREKAIRIVDGQINAINRFLKDYGDYTTPSFKADVQQRLAIAEAARYKI